MLDKFFHPVRASRPKPFCTREDGGPAESVGSNMGLTLQQNVLKQHATFKKSPNKPEFQSQMPTFLITSKDMHLSKSYIKQKMDA